MILSLMFIFIVKHFIVDFLMQGPYEYINKGIYGHPGGILHAWSHAITTWSLLFGLYQMDMPVAVLYAVLEFVIHYHIDWAKIQINTKYKLTPITSERYWHLLGLDQCLHYLTYWIMIVSISNEWIK